MFTHFDRIHERDRQTDRRTDNARRNGPRLCTASRGKYVTITMAQMPKTVSQYTCYRNAESTET